MSDCSHGRFFERHEYKSRIRTGPVLENLEFYCGILQDWERSLVLKSSGNLLNSAKKMKCSERQ